MAEKKGKVREGETATQETTASAAQSKGAIKYSDAYRAVVEEILGRTGAKGEATQVRAKILDGRDQNKNIRRNVKGPVRIGDTLMLRETDIEAQKLRGKGRK